MSTKGLIVFTIAGIVLLSLIPQSMHPAFGQAASTQAPHFGEGGLPQFEKDPNFPRVPSKWRMGFVPGHDGALTLGPSQPTLAHRERRKRRAYELERS